jgi:hypothetical protein
MATWGKREIQFNKYEPKNTLYYDYNTTVDSYHVKVVEHVDYGLGNERYENDYRFSQEVGEAMMEALINHVLAFECSGDVDEFVKQYIENNRFKKVMAKEGS